MFNKKPNRLRKAYAIRRLIHFVYVLPGVAILLLFFVTPLAHTLKNSFHPFSRTRGVDASVVILDHYIKMLTDPYYLNILIRTLRISLIVTLICVVVGYAIGYYLANSSRRVQSIFILTYLTPWFVSIIVKAFGWTLLLAPHGYANKIILWTGIVKSPLPLMWSELGIVIGLVHGFLIFAILAIFTCLVGQDPALRSAAANLGASEWQTFRKVTLPLSLPGVLVGSVIVFTLSMSAFVTPTVLGGRRFPMMSNLAYNQSVVMLNWPLGGAIAIVLMLLTVAVVLGYQRLIVMGKWKVVFQ